MKDKIKNIIYLFINTFIKNDKGDYFPIKLSNQKIQKYSSFYNKWERLFFYIIIYF